MDPQFVISVAASFVAALVVNFLGQVNGLLGRGVLVGLILGRYHRPREEVRIFLLIDLRESDAIAERLGNLRYHAFLSRFISDVTSGVVRHRGEVHRYVGDEVIRDLDRGGRSSQRGLCAGGVCDLRHPNGSSDGIRSRFRRRAQLLAGLHMGPVVTGEIGTVKHEIGVSR